MQTSPIASTQGVQWVDPRPSRPKENSPRDISRSHSRSSGSDTHNQSSSSQNGWNTMMALDTSDPADDVGQLDINSTECKTICMFIEEHLKELQERQRSINLARSKLLNGNYNDQAREDGKFISHGDTSRLKVRDEQTKATETIKQLTNYLRELSYFKNLESAPACRSSTDEETVHRLIDIRISIVQALNDFVLMNSDIDEPIVDTEDSSYRDYDLCFDAQASVQKFNNFQSSASGKPDALINDDFPSVVVVDSFDSRSAEKQTQLKRGRFVGLEKRERDIQKLEKDTVELRQVFLEFYSLVKQHSEPIDSIEDNIVISTQRVREGQNNISRTMKTLTVLVPFTGCVAGALIGGPLGFIAGGKLGGVTIFCATSLLGLISSYSVQRCMVSNKIKRD